MSARHPQGIAKRHYTITTMRIPLGPATLAWLVGTRGGSVTTWLVPPHSTGPLPANVRAAINTGNGC